MTNCTDADWAPEPPPGPGDVGCVPDGTRSPGYRGPWFTPDDALAMAAQLGEVSLHGTALFSPDGLTAYDLASLLEAAETLRSAASALAARAAVALEDRTREERAARNLPQTAQHEGVAQQVAFARGLSPHRAALRLGTARRLIHRMPRTFAALSTGRLSEERATLVARDLGDLDPDVIERLDEYLNADPAAWDGLGDRAVRDRVARAACQLAPEAMAAEAELARRRRHVTVRPGQHGMATLSARLPAADARRVHATLARVAEAAHGTDAARDRSGRKRHAWEIMADTLVDRVTSVGDDPDLDLPPSHAPVEVGIILTDRTLFAGDAEPAVIDGYGTVPAETARQTILDTDEQNLFFRRLYTHPTTGQLVAMDSRARIFPAGLKRLIRYRDRQCRTPFCDAPIRHTDHIVSWTTGGPTSYSNGQGLCARCNQAKEAPGHSATRRSGEPPDQLTRHTVSWTTPTGQVRNTSAPPPPGTPAPDSRREDARPRGSPPVAPAAPLTRLPVRLSTVA